MFWYSSTMSCLCDLFFHFHPHFHNWSYNIIKTDTPAFCSIFLENLIVVLDGNIDASGLQLYLKRDSGTGVSCEFCKIFKNSFLYRTPLVAVSAVFHVASHKLSRNFWKTISPFKDLSASHLLISHYPVYFSTFQAWLINNVEYCDSFWNQLTVKIYHSWCNCQFVYSLIFQKSLH